MDDSWLNYYNAYGSKKSLSCNKYTQNILRRKNTALNELVPASNNSKLPTIRSCGCGTPRWTQAFCKWSSSVLFWKHRLRHRVLQTCLGIMVSSSVSKEISSTSRAMTGHLLVLIKALRAITTDSGILRPVLGRRNYSHFIPLILFIPSSSLLPSWSAVLGYLISGFLSLTGITSSYELKPNSFWSVKNWLLDSVCIIPLMETKSLLCWELTKWKCPSFSGMFSSKWLAFFFEWSGYICWNMERVRKNIFRLKSKCIKSSLPFLSQRMRLVQLKQ